MPKRVFITAAEASGDQHAAELARELKLRDPQIQLEGIGGPKMAASGVILRFESVGRAAMGWRGALRAVEVLKWMRWLKKYYRQAPPDLHICVDSSAMNLPMAHLAKKLNVPVMYYIAPQLWASREGRMKKLRRDVDHVACILPFEEQYFRAHGVKATYVGHPLFDELPADRTPPAGARFPNAEPVIGLVPGSRRAEVRANLPPMLQVAKRLRDEFAASFVIPTTEQTHAMVETLSAGHPVQMHQSGFDQVIPRCDLCLVKSGTSTLHVAAFFVPMIVVYRTNGALGRFAKRWLINTKKIALVNILAGDVDFVPEFFPWCGPVDPVAECALDMLRHPEKLAAQREKLKQLIAPLDRRGASRNAAKLAMDLIQSSATKTTFP